MTDAIILVIILAAALWKAGPRTDRDMLGVSQSSCVKGLAAVILILLHIKNYLQNPGFVYSALSTAGYLLVAVFFFYSGFGITKRELETGTYMKKRLPKRLLYLIKMVIITETVYLAAYALMGRKFTLGQCVGAVLGVELVNGALWYIVALIVIFAVLLLLNGASFKGSYTFMAVIAVTVYFALCLLRGRDPHEGQSFSAFVLGTFLAEHENEFENKMAEKPFAIKLGAASAGAFVLFYALPYAARSIGPDYYWVRVAAGLAASVSFITALLCLLRFFRLENPVLRWWGSMFTEIYLCHGLVIFTANRFFSPLFTGKNSVLLSLGIILVTLAVSAAVKAAEVSASKFLEGRKNESKDS